MICSKPFRKGGEAHGCGQCLPCRLNRRRLWTARLMLEASLHPHSVFVTLTYSDENLPAGQSLSLAHYRDFLKRLRSRLSPRRISFYLVGEYGDRTSRPHYHAALFNVSRDDLNHIEASWPFGKTNIGDLTEASAQYLCGYMTDFLIGGDREDGRQPEFARMSLRPALGKGAAVEISRVLREQHDLQRADVPDCFRLGRKKFPLGRYLRGVIRELSGMERSEPQSVKWLRQISRQSQAYSLGVGELLLKEESRRVNSLSLARSRVQLKKSRRKL